MDSLKRTDMSSGYVGRGRLSLPMVLLLAGILLLVGATVQGIRTAQTQQRTVSTVLQKYALVAGWNFEQQVVPALERRVVEPSFHPLHMVSYEDGRVAPHSIQILLNNPRHPMCEMCGAPRFVRERTRFGLRFFVRSDDIESSGAAAPALVQSIVAEVRGRHRTASPEAMLDVHDGMHGVHVLTAGDDVMVVMYYAKRVPADTVIYALVTSPDALAPIFDSVLETKSLLPDPLVAGVDRSELLDQGIYTSEGRLIYGVDVTAPHVGERVLRKLGGMRIRVGIHDAAEEHLILGGTPALRWPFLLALLILATGMLVLALSQMRREQALARLRSDFVSSVSHELRTPLALQRIFLDMLKLGRVDTAERRAWCLDNIDRESTRLAHLVENVLQFSRTERGTMRIAAERIRLAPAIADIVRAFQPLAETAQVQLETRLQEDVSAQLDAAALRQVLMNILENAVKYGPAGQRVLVQLELAADNVARITVDDQGPGIPHDERESIFRPFSRGAATLDTAVAGSGIGLSVVRSLVRAHSGRVFVTDRPGGGARFVIELPRATRDDGSAGSREPASASAVARLN